MMEFLSLRTFDTKSGSWYHEQKAKQSQAGMKVPYMVIATSYTRDRLQNDLRFCEIVIKILQLRVDTSWGKLTVFDRFSKGLLYLLKVEIQLYKYDVFWMRE